MARLGDDLDIKLFAAVGRDAVDQAGNSRQMRRFGGFGGSAELAIEVQKVNAFGQRPTAFTCDVFADLVLDRFQNPLGILAVNMEWKGFFHAPFYEAGLRSNGRPPAPLCTVGAQTDSKQVETMARANDWAGKVMALINGGNATGAIAQIKVAPSVKDLKALQTVMTLSRMTGKYRNVDAAIAENLALLSAPRLHRSP